MKKIIFIFMFFIMIFSIYGNEKIVDLKFKIDGDSKFYPVDENGKMDYGFYKYKYGFFNKLITLEDETIDPFKEKVSLDLIEKLSLYNRQMINNAIGIGLGFGFSATFIFGGILNLYYTLVIREFSINSSANLLSLSVGIIFLTGGAIEFILGIVSIGLTSYYGYQFNKTKKEIIDILNSSPVSIKTDKLKIRFVLNLSVASN